MVRGESFLRMGLVGRRHFAGIWSAIDLLFIALVAAGLPDATLEVCWILALLIPLACAVIVSILYLKRIS